MVAGEIKDEGEAEGAVPVTPPSGPKKRIPGLAPEVRAQIGRKLMAAYDDVLQQPVPDRFLLLLDQLDAAEKPANS